MSRPKVIIENCHFKDMGSAIAFGEGTRGAVGVPDGSDIEVDRLTVEGCTSLIGGKPKKRTTLSMRNVNSTESVVNIPRNISGSHKNISIKHRLGTAYIVEFDDFYVDIGVGAESATGDFEVKQL